MNNNLEQSNSIDGLDKLISKEKQKQGHSIWGNLIISLILPPFSTLWVLYRVWKNNALHLLLPAMTILYSVLFGLYSYLTLSSPKAFTAVFAGKIENSAILPQGHNFLITILAILLTVVGIIGGLYTRNKAKREDRLSTLMILLLVVILVFQFWISLRELTWVNSVINGSLGNLYQGL